MFRAAFTRWHTTIAAGRNRTARELSQWSRATLAATVGFGTFLMLLGCLFTWGLANVGYELLERGGIGSSDLTEIIGFWAIALLLVFGGDFIRAASWRELRRRRIVATTTPTGASASSASIVVGLLLAPVMLFWGALGLMAFVRLWQMLSSRPASTWWPAVGDAETLSGISAWWLLTMAWLAGGAALIWRGIHALTRRPASSS